MTEQTTSSHRAAEYGDYDQGPSAAAQGFIVFAGVMMILAGSFQAIAGLAAIVQDDFYVRTQNYFLALDATSWGWIHLLVGLIVMFAGFGVLSGRIVARVIGITLAMVSAISNFAFIPYYPFWSLAIITLDIFVIWALAAHGRDLTR